eukprot:TRINITY_DN222_c0_g2_i1.p1 TRINITY_DN222_c0_g2~~TRINITY_DN222_c0_g2_i1.p1  ORF type:complete len:648 (-),score=233.22 TRINITY_DN222_c0_g2_i1:44-1987(-)
MCIRDRYQRRVHGIQKMSGEEPKLTLNTKAKPFVPKAKPVPAEQPPIFMPYPQMPGVPMNYYPPMPNPEVYPPNPIPQNEYQEEEEEEERKPERDAFGILIKKSKKKKKKQNKEQKEQNQLEKKKEAKKEEKKVAPKPKEQPKEDKKEEVKAGEEEKTKPGEEQKVTPAEIKKAEDDEEELPAKYVEVDEKRMPISIVFIGHVDVGKSTICGSIMVITEKVDQRTIKKYEQEAKDKKRDTWWLAYVMDINDDERQRGKTVEVGRATFVTETKRYTIYDAPGHSSYVPNMIMGAAMADIGAFVISAKKGEFESGFDRGGQTLEHLLLAKSLGIQKLVVIINKMDESSVRWSKERYEFIKSQLTPAIVKYGFNVEKNVTWIPLSGLTGANISKPVDKAQCHWYDGPTFMELLENIELPPRLYEGPVRIPVLDKLKDRGTDIFGKVHCGKIQLGSKLVVMPYKIPAEVSAIQNMDDQYVKYAKAGENIKFRLKGIPNEDFIYKGCLLCGPEDLAACFQVFIAEVKIVNMLKHKPIISVGYQCILHLHTLAEECTIEKLMGVKGPKDADFKETKFAKEEDLIKCLIRTKGIIAAEKFSVYRQLGRFTLRDEGKTIAIGTVQKYQPLKENATQQHLIAGKAKGQSLYLINSH